MTEPHARLDPLLGLFGQINHLKQLPRTGWLLAGVAQPESVADHTCATALYALFLALAINQAPSEHGLERPLDVERVVILALIHDLGESVLTDLPKRTTEVLGEAVKAQAETQIVDALLAEAPGGRDLAALWREYQDASTPEGRLVKDVDKLEMVFQASRYAQRGHQNLDEFQQGHGWRFALAAELAAEITRR